MKVSRNGQVSLPADVRRRWATSHVLVLDLGDTLVMRPVTGDPVEDVDAVIGRYRTPVTSDELQALSREEEARIETRKEPP
ncbi:AbrB/MazE/SpoVT family DNA-binding domain-containing protein [Aquipuribacter nitratireducens]|uniref:AbrB/MazE/SpoVT family DNA-binding domain-containing protein n=1 Tax=Aquipuribacter nitratireducens TaxID=650104 RepID=A0ABW0GIN3_9MICO